MTEAEDVFAAQVERWRATSWDTLRSHLKESPVVYEIEGLAGLNYQFEILLMWDDPREETNIRVIIASDDGGRVGGCPAYAATDSAKRPTVPTSGNEPYRRRSAERASSSVTICRR